MNNKQHWGKEKEDSNGSWRGWESIKEAELQLTASCLIGGFSFFHGEKGKMGVPSGRPGQTKIKKQEMAYLGVSEYKTVWLE